MRIVRLNKLQIHFNIKLERFIKYIYVFVFSYTIRFYQTKKGGVMKDRHNMTLDIESGAKPKGLSAMPLTTAYAF